jgi:hypothetical protein
MKHYPASLDDAEDPRSKKWKKQRKSRGFDDTELWNLDLTFATLMLPRIQTFIEYYPPDDKKTKNAYDKIIAALEIIANDENYFWDEEKGQQVNKGLKLFVKHIRGMWY